MSYWLIHKVTSDDIWLFEMATKGIKINLSRFIMNKMLNILKKKEKEAKSKKKTILQSKFAVSYVTLITHYVKTLGPLNPKYELLSIAVSYNLASIIKMGYKNTDNNGIFVKVRGIQDDDDDGEEHAPATQGEQAQNPNDLSLTHIMKGLGEIQLSFGHLNSRLNSMDEHLNSLGAPITVIDRKVSFGACTNKLHGDLSPSQSFEAIESPSQA